MRSAACSRLLTVLVAAASCLEAGLAPAAPVTPSAPAPPGAPAPPAPLLVVLSDTGQRKGSLPLFRLHPDGGRIADGLLRGFPARVVRLYRLEQTFLHLKTGVPIEPAYLEFSRRQGGFPGFGFSLAGSDKPGTGYVDLHEQQNARPRFGGIDQIFPHELAHVMMQQLVGELPPGGSTQGHAIAVRTDAVMAFAEGFAEHFQVMALDDPDADPGTRQLLADSYWQVRTEREMAAYRKAMVARWAPGARPRLMFLFWYSGAEQAMRYYAVKANGFAREVNLPERLLRTGDPYAAYLLENTLPGPADGQPKSAGQMLATEGVVSTLFWRWGTCAALRNRYREEAFYAAFGARRADIPPDLNVYLKMFFVFERAKPHTTLAAIDAYKAAFPDEAADLDRLVREVLLGRTPARAGEIWLTNETFRVGTRVFDQLRAAPQPHTFDLNAASLVDLVAVPGVSLELARAIRAGAPYALLQDLRRVSGVGNALMTGFERMAARAKDVRVEEGASTLVAMLAPTAKRALLLWLAAAAAGMFLFRRARRCGMVRASVCALGASLAALLGAWVTGSLMVACAAPALVFALPALLLSLRRRSTASPRATALAWLGATAPALLVVTPMF